MKEEGFLCSFIFTQNVFEMCSDEVYFYYQEVAKIHITCFDNSFGGSQKYDIVPLPYLFLFSLNPEDQSTRRWLLSFEVAGCMYVQ